MIIITSRITTLVTLGSRLKTRDIHLKASRTRNRDSRIHQCRTLDPNSLSQSPVHPLRLSSLGTHRSTVLTSRTFNQRQRSTITTLLVHKQSTRSRQMNQPKLTYKSHFQENKRSLRLHSTHNPLPSNNSRTINSDITAASSRRILTNNTSQHLLRITLLRTINRQRMVRHLVGPNRLTTKCQRITTSHQASHRRSHIMTTTRIIDQRVNPSLSTNTRFSALNLRLHRPPNRVTLLRLRLKSSMTRRATSPINTFMSNRDITHTNRLLNNNGAHQPKSRRNRNLTQRSLKKLQLGPPKIPHPISSKSLSLLSHRQILISPRCTNYLTQHQTRSTNRFKRIIHHIRALSHDVPVATTNRIIPLQSRITRQTTIITRQSTTIRTTDHLNTRFQFPRQLMRLTPILSTSISKPTHQRLPSYLRRASQIDRNLPP